MALAGRRTGEDSCGRGQGARAHQEAAVRAFLSHGPRDRGVGARPAETDPVPGPRLGGQFGRVLRPAHHRSRSAQHRRAVRALHQRGAQRAAGHRRRLRARETRGSHPARVREVRARARGAGCNRHHLSAEERDSRRRQGAGARPGHDRSPREDAGVLGQLGGFPQQYRQPGAAAGCGRHPTAVRAGEGAAEFPATSVAARRWVRDRARPGQRPGADRERGDARAPGDPVGQERSGVARPAQSRRARARHADGPATDVRSAGEGRHGPHEHGADSARGSSRPTT